MCGLIGKTLWSTQSRHDYFRKKAKYFQAKKKDFKTFTVVYYALANSYLRYGILAWGNATDSIIQPLDTLINRCVRIMSFAPFGHIQISPIYECLDILNVENTFNLETAKFIFKSINGLLPIGPGQEWRNEQK